MEEFFGVPVYFQETDGVLEENGLGHWSQGFLGLRVFLLVEEKSVEKRIGEGNLLESC